MKMKEYDFVSMELLDKKKQVDKLAYDNAYEFWQTEWSIAISDLGLEGLSVNISDKFVSADEILVLREGGNIVALALINHIDLNFAAYKDISYLKTLPDDAMAFIFNNGIKKIMTSGYNIVCRKYRRAMIRGLFLSVALPGAAIALFEMRSEFDLFMGMPLIASGNQRTLARLGMKDMPGGSITIHNVKAQFMYMTRDDVRLGKHFGKYDESIRSLFPYESMAHRTNTRMYASL
ncbi:hypothetical protein H6G97_30395 [Nostoc flagelliforme FACHB-838]|uniref:Uncharacterized protein n=1 Tax=Nostoc flagelliforme FACHB-838 TaxID=2692904 RepID=A0ABR8DWM0_9NOSO|nr:hypothetical protein [Nostoc flagelliforme]MBD2533629.1 hypothetical protein [Nostoc flagelliforme FACHB-838]